MKFGYGQIRILRFLKENANAEGECSRYVQEIADAVALTRQYVTEVTSRFVKMGLISRKQTFDEEIYPDKNLYRILQPEIIDTMLAASDEWHYVNFAEQLTLPFPPNPPNEKTILASRARLEVLFFAVDEECR